MEKVKNAIILAAGRGSRLQKYSLDLPKPLLLFNGQPLIERTIEKLKANGINNIFVVVGYKASMFSELESKYDGVKLIYNKRWFCTNNISSADLALNNCSFDEGTLILDCDLIFEDMHLLKEIDQSGYYCEKHKAYTNEYFVEIDKKFIITKLHKDKCQKYLIRGFSYWTSQDFKKLQSLFRKLDIQKLSYLFFDDIPLDLFFSAFQLKAYLFDKNILEIDTCEEYEALCSFTQ